MPSGIRSQQPDCLVIAHRGAPAAAMENTMAAVRAAADEGADMVEVDVRLTADGVPVLAHDPDLRRTAADARTIASMSLEELREIDLGGAPPATLAECLHWCSGRLGLDVEIKEPAATGPALAVIWAAQFKGRLLVSSFHRPVLMKVARAGNLATALIIGTRTWNPVVRWREFYPWPWLRGAGAGMLVPHQSLVHRGLMARARRQGVEVFAWLSQEDDRRAETIFPRLLRLDVDGIITGRPGLLRSLLAAGRGA
ncbi:glycerophosphodiester phosphodiesterase [bacterium]|nr:glycerophosphodiester phosphodiesterase [candidate division CSSED10-310 bacterium]